MAFLPSAEPAVMAAFWTGAATLVLTGVLLLYFLFFRLWSLLCQKQRQRALQRWRPLLMSSLYEQPDALPRLSCLDLPHVLELWNHLHESLGNDARLSLERLAGQARIPQAVSRMLRRKRFYARYLAVRTAGNLRLASSWEILRELLASSSPSLSFAAARALTRIDAASAVPLLMPSLVSRNDWYPGAVAEMLHEAGAGLVAEPLCHAFPLAPAATACQLLRYLAEVAPDQAAPLISRTLAKPANDERLLNACLDLLTTPQELAAVRALARHASWPVRVHAARALGRIGTHEDEGLLTDMLGDAQWWVRYRAAQALSQLPGMNGLALRHIKDTQPDSDARDMLHQAMAERELHKTFMAAAHG